MTQDDKPRFVAAIAMLCECFRMKPTKAMVSAYWKNLDDLSIDAVERAIERCSRSLKWFPAVHELRSNAGAVDANDQSELAWGAVLKAIRDYGGWANLEFDDRGIVAAIERMGGWEKLTGTSSDELLKWGRKDFLTIYRAWQRDASPEDWTTGPNAVKGMGSQKAVRIAAPYLEAQLRLTQ